MTKIRKPLSLEHTLQFLLKKVSADEIKKYTNKSISHFYKCADLDDQDHNISFQDAVKLEQLAIYKGVGVSLLDCFTRMAFDDVFDRISKLGISHSNDKNIRDQMIDIIHKTSVLMQTVKKYTKKDTGKINSETKKVDLNKIYDLIFKLETHIARLKSNILNN